MKKLSIFILTGMVIFSCNDAATGSKDVTKDPASATTAAVKMDYPYTIDHPDNWEMGSNENTMIALSALKAYEKGNIDESVKYFGDSIHLQFDEMDTKVSHDSLKAMFAITRGDLKSLDVKMYDWESVISKDKKEEYVTLWYKETWEDQKGKKDSVNIVNDIKLTGGKIIELSENSRKYPTSKK